MANLRISQYPDDAPQARVFTLDNGERFIAIDLGRDTTLILHGRDTEAVASARALTHALIQAAAIIETALTAKQERAG